jgi:putative ABC transport system ATP-binding protein
MEILTTVNLGKTYGKGEAKVEALKKVCFSVSKGEFISIVGPSGSGKSTLLNLLGALDEPTEGKVYIDGREIFAMKENDLAVFRRRNIGFVFQAYNLVPELNVEENIALPLLLDHRKPDKQYLQELLEILGLTERSYHLPNQLSGGQQQRVAIGRALVTKPAIILADEPTGNLDSKNSQDVINYLNCLWNVIIRLC